MTEHCEDGGMTLFFGVFPQLYVPSKLFLVMLL